MSNIDWKLFSKQSFLLPGWYVVATLPVNHTGSNHENKSNDLDGDNRWRKSFGFSKAWFNNGDFWEPSFLGDRDVKITALVTHWAELPSVPELTNPHVYDGGYNFWPRRDREQILEQCIKENPNDDNLRNSKKYRDGFFVALKFIFGL